VGRGGLDLSAAIEWEVAADSEPVWGILGGTFDPVHYAHLAIAEQARDSLGLAGILFVPAGTPPHRANVPGASGEARLEMVELAIADNPAFRISRAEIDRPGPSYSVDTLGALIGAGPFRDDDHASPGGEAVLILSAEAAVELPTWHDPDRLLELCRVAVVPRLGYPDIDTAWVKERFPGREDRFLFLDGPLLGHSASEIRDRVRAGRSIRYLVPPAVERYIHDHALYASTDAPEETPRL
jgi:nicotinate-nucleotide adenylyltransferase